MTDDERHRASLAACERLTKLDAFQPAAVVMLYMPLAGEVDLTPVAIRCFQSGRTVCVPKVDWKRRDMSAVEVTAFDDHVMDTDEHGLRAPRDSRPILPSVIDLVVVPGLAFDTHGHRLGRGGGEYRQETAEIDKPYGTLHANSPCVNLGSDPLPVNERRL